MKQFTLFRDGSLYKGNLHTHTTVSDGRYSPQETVERYKKNGYAFLGITDHAHYGYYPEFETEDFLSIPAAEIHTRHGAKWWHHLIVFGDPETTKIPNHTTLGDRAHAHLTLQELVDGMRERNNLVIYNHPYWSRTDICDIVDLKNIVGMEIYNHNCEASWKCGNSEVFYEHFLWHQNYIWCFGTDDAHGGTEDYCGGYITVKTDDFSHKGIIEAIEKGSFFASAAREGEEAPKILDFYVEDGVAKIWCEPCRDIYMYSPVNSYPEDASYSYMPVHGTPDKPVTYAEMKLRDHAQFVRATVQDFRGNTSWCQPIVLK